MTDHEIKTKIQELIATGDRSENTLSEISQLIDTLRTIVTKAEYERFLIKEIYKIVA